jgi:hypothetical protein
MILQFLLSPQTTSVLLVSSVCWVQVHLILLQPILQEIGDLVLKVPTVQLEPQCRSRAQLVHSQTKNAQLALITACLALLAISAHSHLRVV